MALQRKRISAPGSTELFPKLLLFKALERFSDDRDWECTVAGDSWQATGKLPPASLLQITSPAETGPGAICIDGFQRDRGQVEVFNG